MLRRMLAETKNVHTLDYAAQLGIPSGVNDPARPGQTVTEAECGCCYRLNSTPRAQPDRNSFRGQVL